MKCTNDLQDDIGFIVAKELGRAEAKFGKVNNSPHESYAVILEEYEEAQDTEEIFALAMAEYWHSVKKNNPGYAWDMLRQMKNYAENIVAEWVQVAAMCEKAMAKFD